MDAATARMTGKARGSLGLVMTAYGWRVASETSEALPQLLREQAAGSCLIRAVELTLPPFRCPCQKVFPFAEAAGPA